MPPSYWPSWRHQRVTTCIPCGFSWLRVGCAVPNCRAFAGTTRTQKQPDSLPNNGSCLWRPSRSFSSARSEKAGRRLLKLDRVTVPSPRILAGRSDRGAPGHRGEVVLASLPTVRLLRDRAFLASASTICGTLCDARSPGKRSRQGCLPNGSATGPLGSQKTSISTSRLRWPRMRQTPSPT
jgi:hypothetical protein